MSVEYGSTYEVVNLTRKISDQPIPVPPTPHGWRLCAATAVIWVVNSEDNEHQVLYTWFWKRSGRERVVAAFGGDSDEPT